MHNGTVGGTTPTGTVSANQSHSHIRYLWANGYQTPAFLTSGDSSRTNGFPAQLAAARKHTVLLLRQRVMRFLQSLSLLVFPTASSFQVLVVCRLETHNSPAPWSLSSSLDMVKDPSSKDNEPTSMWMALPSPASVFSALDETFKKDSLPQPTTTLAPGSVNKKAALRSTSSSNDSLFSSFKKIWPSSADPSAPGKPTPPVSIPPPQSFMDNNKFDMIQRIESVKCAALGALSGSVAMAPVAFFHYAGNLPQFELMTDMGGLQSALFAIVYRYAIRTDNNPMLNQGVLGAFVLVRTLPTIQASSQCSALPLSCGEPIGYFNWDMIFQTVSQGIESAALFGGAYLALEFAFSKGWISKFES